MCGDNRGSISFSVKSKKKLLILKDIFGALASIHIPNMSLTKRSMRAFL